MRCPTCGTSGESGYVVRRHDADGLATLDVGQKVDPDSQPILGLAETARVVAERRDYSVRAPSAGEGEVGALTDAFNHMLTQIHQQEKGLRESEARLRAVLNSALSAVIAS